MKTLLKNSKGLIVKQINENPGPMGDSFEVGKYMVRIFKKPGRTLFTCTCHNGTMFCNEPTICKHKIAVLKFILEKE